jgi:DNA-binding response OmpR family regulator
MRNKVLIVDDEEYLIELVRVNLKARGIEVLMAHNGEDGLRMAFNEKPDIIILDVCMPALNGWDVCRLLKSDPITSETLVIFLTASTQKEDIEEAKRVGGDYFLPKPFDIERLIDIITKSLCS